MYTVEEECLLEDVLVTAGHEAFKRELALLVHGVE